MSREPESEDPSRTRERWRERLRKHHESNAMLAILMTGVAALFIVGIVSAFLYASNDQPMAERQIERNAVPVVTGSGVPGASGRPAETTGSGGAAREMERQMRDTERPEDSQ